MLNAALVHDIQDVRRASMDLQRILSDDPGEPKYQYSKHIDRVTGRKYPGPNASKTYWDWDEVAQKALARVCLNERWGICSRAGREELVLWESDTLDRRGILKAFDYANIEPVKEIAAEYLESRHIAQALKLDKFDVASLIELRRLGVQWVEHLVDAKDAYPLVSNAAYIVGFCRLFHPSSRAKDSGQIAWSRIDGMLVASYKLSVVEYDREVVQSGKNKGKITRYNAFAELPPKRYWIPGQDARLLELLNEALVEEQGSTPATPEDTEDEAAEQDDAPDDGDASAKKESVADKLFGPSKSRPAAASNDNGGHTMAFSGYASTPAVVTHLASGLSGIGKDLYSEAAAAGKALEHARAELAEAEAKYAS